MPSVTATCTHHGVARSDKDHTVAGSGKLIAFEPFAQLALLEFAGRRPRNRLHELERVGQPELGELRREEIPELRGCRAGAWLQHDGGERPLVPFRVRDG